MNADLEKLAGPLVAGTKIDQRYLTDFDPKTRKELRSGLFESEFVIVREMAAKQDENLEELCFSRNMSYDTLQEVLKGNIGPYLGGPLQDGTPRRFDPTCSDYYGFVIGLRYFAKLVMDRQTFMIWLNIHGLSEDTANQITPERTKDDYSVRAKYRAVLRASAPAPSAGPQRET